MFSALSIRGILFRPTATRIQPISRSARSILDDDTTPVDLSEDNDAVDGIRRRSQPGPPTEPTPHAWSVHRTSLKEAFPDGWNPPRKLSREAMEGLRQLHRLNPETFSTPVLAQRFRISPEAVRRILKSRWTPSTARRQQLVKREAEARAERGARSERERVETEEVLRSKRDFRAARHTEEGLLSNNPRRAFMSSFQTLSHSIIQTLLGVIAVSASSDHENFGMLRVSLRSDASYARRRRVSTVEKVFQEIRGSKVARPLLLRTMTSKLNVEGTLLFEQPFVRVPYENYRKVFRTTQRNVERDMKAVQASATDLARRSSDADSGLTPEAAIHSIDAMIANVENLKRKLADLHSTSGKPTQDVIRERLQHLAAVETVPSTADPDFGRWADTRLDRWLVDWALRSGRERTARQIAKERHIETLVDIDLFADIKRIEAALAGHSCTEALAWCSENKSTLKKMKCTLEFDLRLQEYIELTRASKRTEAIEYSRKHLVAWQDTHLEQIQQAVALLAFPPETAYGRYKRLYDASRWMSLIQTFRIAIYSLNTLPTEPLLNLSLYAGLASLRLPACHNHATRNVDCPVCDATLGALATDVPFSHHANSTIVCYISGKIMDADNMPLAFPGNGYVYSREAMEDMAARTGGVVTCPRSGASCRYTELRRVYIS
ncbi:hypothetical protein MKEN_00436500 [Mycena kentingensis (nom. inval.)]|nr:hypothetical protein MKEN_00436500 [Mycena kentingensis (nom. inval.)]